NCTVYPTADHWLVTARWTYGTTRWGRIVSMRRNGSESDPGGNHTGRQDDDSAQRWRGDRRGWAAQQSSRPRTPPEDTQPTADEAPTGRFRAPPPRQEPRPYPPPPPPGDHHPGYERYDAAGYTAGGPHTAFGSRDAEGARSSEQQEDGGPDNGTARQNRDTGQRIPRKMTVTRVAALRGRQLSGQAVNAFQRAAKADGAERSGLTSLTYAVMLNYASDAAMAVALANTLFFAATTGESRGRVALYLVITLAPFALVAPVIGPTLDKIQRGRRVAMCIASVGQLLMCVVMALYFDSWLLYPAALGKLVLSKSFMVLKAAVTPRVVPPQITLSKTNARLTVFGLAAAGVFGAIASGFSSLTGSSGALWFTAVIAGGGAVQAMRIPSWVEVTEGE